MGLFLKQTEQRTQLQEKIAADLAERTKTTGGGTTTTPDTGSAMLEDSQEATGRSIFWVGVVTMVIIAAAVFVLFVFNS
jgi:hypothetical protein